MNKIRERVKTSQFIFEKENRPYALISCPFYLTRRNLYKYVRRYSAVLKGTLMDFGCGSKPYRHLFKNCDKYIGVDINGGGHDHKNESIDVIYDGKKLPFPQDTFDSVFSSEVLDHIDNIDEILNEINRVMKKDGLFFVTVAYAWNENELPCDYARYTSAGIRKLLNKHGFKVIKYHKSSCYVEMLFQMKAEYFRILADKTNNIHIQRMVQLFFIMPTSLIGLVISKLYPKDWSFFGTNIVLCKKV